jgi:pyruvate/2-oxoglutarate dehydrogenase complex dihydrolipoamide acyltransferase (E2) component
MIKRKVSEFRKLSIYGFQVTENSHNFYALLEFDITDIRKYLREKRASGKSGSLFSFMLKAIGQCLSLFPDFNSIINLKRISTFEDVDISIPIEIMKNNEVFNKQLVIRNVDKKSIFDIDSEINRSKNDSKNEKGYVAFPFYQRLITILPNFIIKAFFNYMIKNHKMVNEFSGTAFVTSVSMFSNVPGFIIPYIGKPKSCSFAIGSVYKKPIVKNDQIVVREVINITAIFNHDMIDGAPAARFINTLRKYIEINYKELID